jgi:hypothetical protein
MSRANYVASFLAHGAGRAIFVDLYSIRGSRPITYEQYWEIPANQEMKKFGMIGLERSDSRPTVEWFNLELEQFHVAWKGKLIVDWPGGERSWWRRAQNNDFSVRAILEESAFDKAMPEWSEMSLTWDELAILPERWQVRLSQWRGIYYIIDESDGKAYIGSAGGGENILGRWRNYAASGHGGNKLLRQRNPRTFRFSILERVSPDMGTAELLKQENSWKERLRTRPFGLSDN